MCFIVKATVLLLLAQLALCKAHPKLESFWMDCQKDVGVSDEEMAALYNSKSANGTPSEKAKCHVKCMMEKLGFFKNDAFDSETTLKSLSKVPKFKGKDAEISKAINDCKEQKGSSACDTAFLAMHCFKEHPSMELFAKV